MPLGPVPVDFCRCDPSPELTDPRRDLDERLRGNYGRFSVMTMKIALILTFMDWVEDGAQGSPRILLAHRYGPRNIAHPTSTTGRTQCQSGCEE